MADTLAVYVHWPFCKSKCPYCDFNSHVVADIDHAAWQQAYLDELQYFAERLLNKRVSSVFFGGGTPSLMPPSIIESILTAVHQYWDVEDDVEITLEANPTSVECGRFRDIKHAGVNRVSLGVQALDAEDLTFLGREHSVEQALIAVKHADTLFDNFSFDLIYARPGQTVASWKKELKQALDYAHYHLSLYQLTIEKGTPFYSDVKKKKFALPTDDEAAAMYESTAHIMTKAGYEDYEISNYAKPGYRSKHNMSYWHYDEYLGIGPGAHSRLKTPNGREAIMMIHRPQHWLQLVQDKGCGIQSRHPIEGASYVEEFLMMGLRLKEGITMDRFEQHIGAAPEEVFNIDNVLEHKLIQYDKKGLRVTAKGRLLLNHVITELLP